MRQEGFRKQAEKALASCQQLIGRYRHGWQALRHVPLAQLQQEKQQLLKRLFSVLAALLVIAITIGIFLHGERIAELGSYGYLGAFLANLVSNASIFLPVPGGLILFALGAFLPPLLVGLAGGTGAALGEMTGYILGCSGRGIIKNRKAYDKSVEWLRKW